MMMFPPTKEKLETTNNSYRQIFESTRTAFYHYYTLQLFNTLVASSKSLSDATIGIRSKSYFSR